MNFAFDLFLAQPVSFLFLVNAFNTGGFQVKTTKRPSFPALLLFDLVLILVMVLTPCKQHSTSR